MAAKRRPVVLVTGASSGLGNATATFLAKKGYAVYGTSRDPDARPRRADEFFELLRMDASDDDSVSEAVAYVVAREGRIDALVCNAGMGIAGPIEETPAFEAAAQMDVNFLGVVRVVGEALPTMRAYGGKILIVGSMAGRVGMPFQGFYAASKFALEGYVESLRMELVDYPVHVAIIEPGDFRTGFTASRRRAETAADSPYRASFERVMRVVEEGERAGCEPIVMARLVHRLMGKKSLRVRYEAGSRSDRLAMRLRRVLPASAFERLFAAHFRVSNKYGDQP